MKTPFHSFSQRRRLLPWLALLLALMLGVGRAQPTQAATIWHTQTVDTATSVLYFHAMVLDSSGNPVISYVDTINGKKSLRLVHCGNPLCSSGNTYQTLEIYGEVGYTIALVLDSSGNPVISFYELENEDVKLIRCGNPACSSGNILINVDSVGSVGSNLAMVLDSNDNPVISYLDDTNEALKLVHCGDPICSSGNIYRTVDDNLMPGRFTSLALDSAGNPVISYFESYYDDLKLVHCINPTCAFINLIKTVDSEGSVGWYNSLVLDSSGNPVISYYDNTNGDLKLVRCGDAMCGGGNTILTLDSVGDVGHQTSLALDGNGSPVITYRDQTNGLLKLLHCGNPSCSSGNIILTLDRQLAGETALALDSRGYPVVSYWDLDQHHLKLTRLVDDSTPPSVTINQAEGQADPTNSNPIRFTATFSEPVTGFTGTDVTLSGTANLAGATVSVSGGPSHYGISVNGVAGNGTVIAALAAGVVTDAAGNPNTASTSTDNTVTFTADSTPPVITPVMNGTAGNNGWYVSDVTISWQVVDNESTVTSQSGCDAVTVTSDTTGVTFTCSATSAGGSNSQSITIRRDATLPTISLVDRTPANGNGWNNTDVTLTWNCTDATAGVVDGASNQTISSEGANQSATGTCTDQAGNNATDTQSNINLDKSAPTLNPVVTPNPVLLGGTATVAANAADALSGLAGQSCDALDTSSVGAKSVACTATDNAGNTASASVTYTVSYQWTGFFQPVDNYPTVNTVHAGQGIPVRFSLGGDFGLNIFASGYPALQTVSCGDSGGSGSSDAIEETLTLNTSSLHYDPATQTYSYQWKTDKSWAGTCRLLVVRLNDGTDHLALFQFSGKVRSAGAEDGASEETEEGASEETAAAAQRIFLPLINR